MSVCRKLPDGTIQKIAGHTVLLDANASEIREGQASFTNPAWGQDVSVTFSDPMPDTDYKVIIEFPQSGQSWAAGSTPADVAIHSKTTTGFTFRIWPVGTVTQVYINWTAFKLIKLDGYTALQNKVNNPDDTPTIDSMNLVTSDGVARAIENASAVWKGTKAEWNALPLAEKKGYDLAALTDAGYILAVNRTDGVAIETANLTKIFEGTLDEWNALTPAQRDHYEIAYIKGDNSVAGTVVDKVTKDDMRAITSNAVFMERDRGILPHGVNIDNMVGPEWVGTWIFSPSKILGHVPYVAGGPIASDAWYILNIISADNRTVQTLHPLHNGYIARRIYVDGWVSSSDTPVVNTYYGGWHVEYNTVLDVFIGNAAQYGIQSVLRINSTGGLSVFTSEPSEGITIPRGQEFGLYTPDRCLEVLWKSGIDSRRYPWMHWGSGVNWVGHVAFIHYDETSGFVLIHFDQDTPSGSARMNFSELSY